MMSAHRLPASILTWLACLGALDCSAAIWEPPPVGELAVPPVEEPSARSECSTEPAHPDRGASARHDAGDAPSAIGSRLELGPGDTRLELAAGRWVVKVHVAPLQLVTIGLAGPRDALRDLEVVGDGALRRLQAPALEDDRRLPAFVSFEAPADGATVTVVADVDARVELLRVQAEIPTSAPPHDKNGALLPLVGLPMPIERRGGYVLQHPHRYQFVRADVAAALRAAFRQTRVRFGEHALAVGDASQWDGERPATDLGKPRHISHRGGRDVDVAIPIKSGGVARIERRCEGVMVEERELRCAPGTLKNVDGMRLAYLLGLLIDGPTPGGAHVPDAKRRPGPIAVVETIFTDQIYIDEIRRALEVLRRKRWIHDEAYGALGEDGLLRPSPWHTDHVHIRFRGKPAEVPVPLRFAADPPPDGAGTAVPAGPE